MDSFPGEELSVIGSLLAPLEVLCTLGSSDRNNREKRAAASPEKLVGLAHSFVSHHQVAQETDAYWRGGGM